VAVNSCLKSNIAVLAIAMLGISLFTDNTEQQIKALQDQVTSKDEMLAQSLNDALNDARDAKKAALIAEETARIKIAGTEALKKSLLAKGCK
jgi:ABC-type iron transport system FetAB permease component